MKQPECALFKNEGDQTFIAIEKRPTALGQSWVRDAEVYGPFNKHDDAKLWLSRERPELIEYQFLPFGYYSLLVDLPKFADELMARAETVEVPTLPRL